MVIYMNLEGKVMNGFSVLGRFLLLFLRRRFFQLCGFGLIVCIIIVIVIIPIGIAGIQSIKKCFQFVHIFVVPTAEERLYIGRSKEW